MLFVFDGTNFIEVTGINNISYLERASSGEALMNLEYSYVDDPPFLLCQDSNGIMNYYTIKSL